ncbi:MAG: hypothetical protein FWF54_05270 [Candidatus Azobacteroides sp.]|nr:hypothetical protein [Candidatus Azobacteroides sp.]
MDVENNCTFTYSAGNRKTTGLKADGTTIANLFNYGWDEIGTLSKEQYLKRIQKDE